MKKLPKLIAFIILIIILVIPMYKLYSELEEATNNKKQVQQLKWELSLREEEVSKLEDVITMLDKEVLLRQDLTSLIVDAARSYNLDPMLLAKVIKSESNFRPNPKHTLPHITGPGGINTKAHSKLKHNPNSYVGNIYASAEVLSYYLEDSDSLILALTRYKGLSPLGLSQAKSILKEYKNENSLLSTP